MINLVTYQGRLTKAPELKTTNSGVEYLTGSIAWNEKYKEVEANCFLPIKAWRQNAKFISDYFTKGQEIAIVGHLITEQWDTDGETKSRLICIVDKVHFCGSKITNTINEKKEADASFMDIPAGIDEEIPF